MLACAAQAGLAARLAQHDPPRFTYHPSSWRKFSDGTDHIELGGFAPTNRLRGQHVLFVASFADNDTTLSQVKTLEAREMRGKLEAVCVCVKSRSVSCVLNEFLLDVI